MRVLLALSLMLLWGTSAFASESREKVFGLYGVNPSKAPFLGMSEQQKVEYLKGLGANAVWGGYDDPEFVSACKAQGLDVYASLGIFAGEKHWKEHPESRPVDAQGKPFEKSNWYAGVCPTQKWLREEKLREVRKKAESGLIDGLWLDFIRYPIHWELCVPRENYDETCFCPSCLEKFQRDTGGALGVDSASEAAEILLGEKSAEWYRWRAQQITDFVRDASEVLHDVNPDAKLGIFTVPWREKDYNNAIYKIVGQDYQALAPHVDVFSPMVYHAVCGEKPVWVHEVTEYISKLTGKPVWPITQAFDKPYTIGPEEFEASLRAALKPPSQGVILFSFSRMVEQKKLEQLPSIAIAVRETFGKIKVEDE